MPTSMVLRFRDLVASTIIEHRNLIEKYGYVWWGWWNKPDEKIPWRTFTKFQDIIREEGSLNIYLIDSGNKLLYKAQLLEIDSAKEKEVKQCREPEKAPEYYGSAEYKVWFRFVKIEDAEIEEIRNWTYDEASEFLDDPTGSEFQDKRVFNVQEMLNRHHRTIYFIKPYNEDQHEDYFIEFVPSIGVKKRIEDVKVVPPIESKDFITEPIFRKSTYILHLSDLHLSTKHHKFTRDPKRVDRPLVDQLEEYLKDQKPPAAVIISGDFTWQGLSKEFDLAKDFISHLQSQIDLRPEHFVIVPGNHDIQWSEQSEDAYDLGKPVTNPPEQAEKNYREFLKEIVGFEPNEFCSMGRRYILGNYIALDIIGLNSCRLEQEHFAGYGYVGLDQLNKAVDSMNWEHEKDRVRYRILAVHHHVIPVTSVEEAKYDMRYSLTLDAAQLTYRALALGVNLLAHGHTHQPFASGISRAARGSVLSPSHALAIHAAGSAGVKREHIGAIGKNSFSLYQFDEEGIKVQICSTSENIEGFEDDWDFRIPAIQSV